MYNFTFLFVIATGLFVCTSTVLISISKEKFPQAKNRNALAVDNNDINLQKKIRL
jgi:hypothetical protein